eukprot:8033626-Alexandrium_andersonii.AAC.1
MPETASGSLPDVVSGTARCLFQRPPALSYVAEQYRNKLKRPRGLLTASWLSAADGRAPTETL